jgi:hypothetical protein
MGTGNNARISCELIRRVDPQHRSYGQFIRDELDSKFYVGVPNDEVEARVSPLMFYTVRTRSHTAFEY